MIIVRVGVNESMLSNWKLKIFKLIDKRAFFLL